MAHYQTTRPRDNRVRGAARTGPQALMRKRHGNVTRTGADGGLGLGPVHGVTLRVAAADLP